MPPKKANKPANKPKTPTKKASGAPAGYSPTSRLDKDGRKVYTKAGKDYVRRKKPDGTFGMRLVAHHKGSTNLKNTRHTLHGGSNPIWKRIPIKVSPPELKPKKGSVFEEIMNWLYTEAKGDERGKVIQHLDEETAKQVMREAVTIVLDGIEGGRNKVTIQYMIGDEDYEESDDDSDDDAPKPRVPDIHYRRAW